jgi:hypothetical protein
MAKKKAETSIFGKPVQESYGAIYARVDEIVDVKSSPNDLNSKIDSLVCKEEDRIHILYPVKYEPALNCYEVENDAEIYTVFKNRLPARETSSLAGETILKSKGVYPCNSCSAVFTLKMLFSFLDKEEKKGD